MADIQSRSKAEDRPRLRLSFSRKLTLGITALSILSLIVMFTIVNTVVRNIIYDNVISITKRDNTLYAREIDAWFKESNKFVEYLAITWLTVGIEPGEGHGIDPIAARFVEEFDFFMEVYMGFQDGRFMGGSGWIPDADWDPTTRPWYKAAVAAEGEIVTVLPFVDDVTGDIVSAVAQWVPDLGGQEAVIAVGIRLDHILDMVRRHDVAGGGYLLLIGPGGEIISHPNPFYNPTPDGRHNIVDIHNGALLMGVLESGETVVRFDDFRLGLSYFMVFPLEAAGWTLAAVIPAVVTQRPVLQNLALIMVTMALFLIAMFIFTMFFVSRLTRTMEETRVAEERVRLIFDNMPMVSNVRDRDFNILSCNAEAPKLFGLQSKQEYVDRFFELSPEFQPDGSRSDEKARELISTAFVSGKASFEWMHQKPDGEQIPCEVTLVRVDQNHHDFLVAFVRDLRAFYEANKKERMLVQRLQAVLDSSPLMCFIFDESCNIIEANREVERLFGLQDRQVFMDKYFDFSPELQPDGTPSRNKALAEVKKALETGGARYEWMYQRLDGTPIPSEEILQKVTVEGRDLVIAYTRDLRDLHKYLEAESIAQQRLQAMLDSSPLICSIFDEDFRIVEANEEVVSIFRIPDKRVYMERFFDLVPEYQPDGSSSFGKALAELKKTLQTGEGFLEWMHQTLDGEPIPTEVYLKRVKLDGKNFVIAHGRDLRDLYKYMEANKRMQFIFDAVPLVLTSWDKDLNMIECNEEAVRRFGLAGKEEFKERFFELSPEFQPDGSPSKEKAIEYMQKGFSTGHVEFEWMHRKPDGTDIPSEVLCFRSRFRGEEILLTCDRDLRELKESQRREREMSIRIQLMFNATPLIIEYWNREYDCIECNKTALDFYGFTSIEEHKHKVQSSMPEFQPNGKPSWEQWTMHLEKIFEEGYARFDFMEKRPNGDQVFLEILGVRMKYDNNLVVVTYANDVTQLKKALVRMREADERTKLMLNGTPVACYLINSDFEAIDCNNETLKLFDFEDKGEGIGKFREVFSKYWFYEMRKHFSKALESGSDRFEWVLQKPGNGEAIPCDIAFIRFSHREEFVVAAYIFDLRVLKEMLRERQRVESAEESSRAKSRFLARMSHEIRTPLSAVLGISEIQLQNPTLPTSMEEAFAKIHNSASTLLGIVNDILDLSKIEAGKMSLVNEKYEVASLISDVVQLHIIYQNNKKVKFQIKLDEQIPAFLIGDELRIKQILGNLLSNAFKYTESGAVELSVRCEADVVKENHVMLAIGISDTGMGMTKTQVDALYDEYTRFHEQEKRLVGGTGLGMPIVYSLVQMMGGQITVESEVGEGTKVLVYVPQKVASQEVLGPETVHNLQQFEMTMGVAAKRFKFTPEPMPYGRVLVVDDVEANLYVAQSLLLFYDLAIETCNSGHEAIEKIRQGNVYDIMFMDHMMPNLDGVETTAILREMGYTHPIVALTANALIGQAEEFMRNGFDGFISKPIQTTHLNTILIKFIRDKQPQEVIEAARSAGSRYVASQGADGGIESYLERPEVANKLRADFARSQKNVLSEISQALDSGDPKTAHRLAHTLKGLAGIIKESRLAKVSGDLEALLNGDEGQPDAAEEIARRMSVLEEELILVFNHIESALSNAPEAEPERALGRDKTKELLDRLAESLNEDSAENLDLIEELRGIPEAAILVRQVEELDFETASKTLATLRDVLEV